MWWARLISALPWVARVATIISSIRFGSLTITGCRGSSAQTQPHDLIRATPEEQAAYNAKVQPLAKRTHGSCR